MGDVEIKAARIAIDIADHGRRIAVSLDDDTGMAGLRFETQAVRRIGEQPGSQKRQRAMERPDTVPCLQKDRPQRGESD
jgi:hypothetical protein